MGDGDEAQRAHERAGLLFDERRFVDAIEPASEACRLRPDWADAWRAYCVALKHAHRWADCLAASERAIELDPDDGAGPSWNAGIAATALGNWSRARRAWNECGIEVPVGEGPLVMDVGVAGVRISPHDQPEVVYCKRIDPCRARILSVPTAESERRYGDVVLHDGEPRGSRDGGRITVFDELILLQRSEYGTWKVQTECRDEKERDAIIALFDDVDGAVEDWTESLTLMCKQCSLGEPHEHHEPPVKGWRTDRQIGLALRDERELRRLRHLGLVWRRGVRDVTRVS